MKKYRVAFYSLMILPLIFLALSYNFIPEQIPAHFGWSGEVTRWGSKLELLILPLITIVLGFGLLKIPNFANKKESEGDINSQRAQLIAGIVTLAVFNFLTLQTLYTAFNEIENLYASIDYYKLLFSALGIMLIVIGSVMPKMKKNSFIGLRTKWSMSSDRAWQKSQRFGGIGLMITGVLLFLGNIFFFQGKPALIFSSVVIAVDLLVSVAYTYFAARDNG